MTLNLRPAGGLAPLGGFVIALALGCSADRDENGSTGPGGGGDGAGTGADDGDSGDDGEGDGDRLDVAGGTGGPGDNGGCDPAIDEDCGCTGVDVLFIVDNSVSMNDYQVALGMAFPDFADAMIEVLPPGTSLHVGVTSTEMGHSNSGSTSNCMATGDNGQPQDAFYQTPDTMNNGINGAQGRLYDPGTGQTYYDISTNAPPAEVQAMKDWFSLAANVGEGGSQIEMSAAPAGWFADPANAATNDGFLRDEGAVLVIFILQDEPDQTPTSAAMDIVARVTAAKSQCGGLDCVIGGGFLDTNCLNQTPLGTLFGSLPDMPVVSELPDENLAEDFPDQAAGEMNQLLRDTLASVIAKKCEEIPPPQG